MALDKAAKKAQEDDLNENRRLLYMVLFGGLKTERSYNLAGTLINALAHHSHLATVEEVMGHLEAIEASDAMPADESAWVRGLIAEITDRLGDSPAGKG